MDLYDILRMLAAGEITQAEYGCVKFVVRDNHLFATIGEVTRDLGRLLPQPTSVSKS